MLSYILSGLFRFCFVLAIIAGLAAVTVQVRQKPFQVRTGKNSYINIGEPGLKVIAFRSNNVENAAPDTSISYQFRDTNNRMIGSGRFKTGVMGFFEQDKKLDELIDANKNKPGKIMLDTVITVIGQRHDVLKGKGNNYYIEMNDDSSSVYVKTLRVTGQKDSVARIKFRDLAAAEKYALLDENRPVNRITEDRSMTQGLRIMPADRWQQFGFIVYQFTSYVCLALVFLCLGRLFSNFRDRKFFTGVNVKLLKRTGWFFLIPALAAGLLYWIFLVKIHPVKLVMGPGDYNNTISYYAISTGVDTTQIILGAGLLVLGYIFANGLKMKEENESFI